MHILLNNINLLITLAILFAWIIGEIGYQVTKIPKICFYTLTGFICFVLFQQIEFNANNLNLNFIVNIGIGILIFEFGHRINFHWLKNNPKIILTSLIESTATFTITFLVTHLFISSKIICLEYASLSIASSPIVIMYLINYNKSSGQLTERLIHLSALNTIIAIITFKFIFGLLIFRNSGNILQTAYASVLMLLFSILLAIIFAGILSIILNKISLKTYDYSIAFAIFVICLVSLATDFKLSPLLTCLTFGLILRHKRVAMGHIQNHFGSLGELLTIILFLLIATTLQFNNSTLNIYPTIILIVTRILTKTIFVGLLSRFDELSWSKSFLVGFGLSPISMFSLLTLDPTIYNGIPIFNQLAYFSLVFLLLELIAPICTQFALSKAKEVL